MALQDLLALSAPLNVVCYVLEPCKENVLKIWNFRMN